MEISEQVGITAAKRQSWRSANPRDLLKRLAAENPEASADELRNLHWESIEEDKTQLRAMQDYWFDRNYESLTRQGREVGMSRSRRVEETTIKTKEIRSAITQKIEEKVRIALLEMTMPSGKLLRNTTREELHALGGWAGRVAEKLRPGETVAAAGLSEETLRELYE